MATLSTAYRASSNLTVTNLHSLAASATFVAGWESALIDNSSNLDVDILISGKFTMASSNNQAGEIRVYLAGMLDDSTWPDVLDGTESTETFTDTEERDAACVLARVLAVDASAGAVIYMAPFGVAQFFGGVCPHKLVLFITGSGATSTNAQFAASGNQITAKGVNFTIA
jgi:hypothetical protein